MPEDYIGIEEQLNIVRSNSLEAKYLLLSILSSASDWKEIEDLADERLINSESKYGDKIFKRSHEQSRKELFEELADCRNYASAELNSWRMRE